MGALRQSLLAGLPALTSWSQPLSEFTPTLPQKDAPVQSRYEVPAREDESPTQLAVPAPSFKTDSNVPSDGQAANASEPFADVSGEMFAARLQNFSFGMAGQSRPPVPTVPSGAPAGAPEAVLRP